MHQKLEDIRTLITAVQGLEITPIEAIWRIDAILHLPDMAEPGQVV